MGKPHNNTFADLVIGLIALIGLIGWLAVLCIVPYAILKIIIPFVFF
jgi:hypothetical protein